MVQTVIIYDSEGFTVRVRNILRAEESEISDDMINSADFKGIAEIAVKNSVPAWQDILNSGDESRIELLKTCVVLETAICLIPSMKHGDRKVEQTTNSKVEYFDNAGLEELLAHLYERLKMLYSQLNDENIESCAPIGLTMTNPNKKYFGGGFV